MHEVPKCIKIYKDIEDNEKQTRRAKVENLKDEHDDSRLNLIKKRS